MRLLCLYMEVLVGTMILLLGNVIRLSIKLSHNKHDHVSIHEVHNDFSSLIGNLTSAD